MQLEVDEPKFEELKPETLIEFPFAMVEDDELQLKIIRPTVLEAKTDEDKQEELQECVF